MPRIKSTIGLLLSVGALEPETQNLLRSFFPMPRPRYTRGSFRKATTAFPLTRGNSRFWTGQNDTIDFSFSLLDAICLPE